MPRRDYGVVDLNVARHLLEAKPDGVDRNSPAAKCGDRIQIHPAGIVCSIAEQHHRTDGQVAASRQLLQAVANARGGGRRRRLQFVQLCDARKTASTR